MTPHPPLLPVRKLSFLFLLLFCLNAPGQELLEICTEAQLRGAVSRGGVIELNCPTNLITLTEPLVIERNTTIRPFSTNAEVVMSGGNATRLFVVRPGATLQLDRIALFSGRITETNPVTGGIPETAGAGIYVDGGAVIVNRGRFESHSVIGLAGLAGAPGGEGEMGESGGDAAGAAIYNNGGSVTLSNTVFSANTVTAGAGGKGGDGRNEAGQGGRGGSAGGAAIYSQGGTVRVFNSSFTNNAATGGAGGLAGAATGVLGFPNDSGASGDAVGAAIAGADAVISIYGSTFVNNRVKGADGAAGTAGIRNLEGLPGQNGGAASGGAIFSTGVLNITNSTFFGNSATSGKGGNGGQGGPASFGRDGGDGGDGGLASGGAVEASGGGAIIHSTFSDNTLVAGAGGAGGAAGGSLADAGDAGNAGRKLGESISALVRTLNLANSILATGFDPSLAGTIADLGGNLSNEASPLLNATRSYPRMPLRLRSLTSNGGPTATIGLQTNSPAINKGALQFCVPFDQRGSNRVDQCDIGAFELIVPPPPPVTIPTNLVVTRRFTNDILTLAWPAAYSNNLFLQFNTNLSSTNWTTVPTPPRLSSSGSNFIFELPTSTNVFSTFFRLASSNAVGGGKVTNTSGTVNTNTGPPVPPSP